MAGLLAVLLPLLVLAWVQHLGSEADAQARELRIKEARVLASNAERPPAELASATQRPLPLHRAAGESGALWVELALPPHAEAWRLALSYRPALAVFIDGLPLVRDDEDGERLVLGSRRLSLPISPLTPSTSLGGLPVEPKRRLQLRLAAPGPSGAGLDAPLFGPPDVVDRLDAHRRHWQLLRAATLAGGLLVALFLGLVARVRREEPLFAMAAAHVALLALLLSPYVLAEQPLPSPWWRALLDAADLAAKLLLVAVAARLAGAWSPRLQRSLLLLGAIALPIDVLAAVQGWSWGQFAHPWPWWALGLRSALLLAAWAYALRALSRRPAAETLGTAMLVGFSALTWAWVSFGVLVFERPVIDSNALAHAGWVMWVAAQLQALFVRSARQDAELRRELADELERRSAALQVAYAAQAQAERREAAADQRRRLLQDLHDGLGARLLQLRLTAPQLQAHELAEAVDACLLEMRLSVDSLSESEGELAVLLGSWRQRVEPLLEAAGVQMHWQVHHSEALACLRGGGALELVRWLQEALSNTLRHARARTLTVATEATAGGITLWFVDDGCGLPSQAGDGQGRRNLRARAARLGAALHWHSPAPRAFVPEGVGTALELQLKG